MNKPAEEASKSRIRDLETRLEEARETLAAIRNGQVDALVVASPEGDKVYTLHGADYPYRIIVEQMSEGAATVVQDGTILYGNYRLAEMLGRPLDTIAGIAFISFVAPGDYSRFDHVLCYPQEGRQEMRLIDTRGRHIPVQVSARPLDIDGQDVICLVVTDLTFQKRLEEKLRQSQKMEAIGTLAGGIAHDFNNILAIIMGNVEMGLDDPHGCRRNLEQILKASKRARDLVRQILTFSRTERGEKEPVSLRSILDETCALMRPSIPVTIDIRLDVEAEADTIKADRSQIQQVIMNLVTNAVHAIPDARGTIGIQLSNAVFRRDDQLPNEEMETGNYVKLTVTDTGCGMTEAIRGRIFDPFFTTKEPGKGTGMGLSVTYGIVKDHRGSIMVESRPGKGARFTVFFPLIKLRPAEESRENRSGGPAGSERILLVDDEKDLVETLSMMLKRLGYDVVVAKNGTEALGVLARTPAQFQLVITDQTMPDITGLQLAGEIKNIRKDLPVILSTGYSEAVNEESAIAAGISALVMKPIIKTELAGTIRAVLDRKTSATK